MSRLHAATTCRGAFVPALGCDILPDGENRRQRNRAAPQRQRSIAFSQESCYTERNSAALAGGQPAGSPLKACRSRCKAHQEPQPWRDVWNSTSSLVLQPAPVPVGGAVICPCGLPSWAISAAAQIAVWKTTARSQSVQQSQSISTISKQC